MMLVHFSLSHTRICLARIVSLPLNQSRINDGEVCIDVLQISSVRNNTTIWMFSSEKNDTYNLLLISWSNKTIKERKNNDSMCLS